MAELPPDVFPEMPPSGCRVLPHGDVLDTRHVHVTGEAERRRMGEPARNLEKPENIECFANSFDGVVDARRSGYLRDRPVPS